MKAAAPSGADPHQALSTRALEVVGLTHAVLPTASEIVSRIGDLVDQPNPRQALAERRALTSVVARVAAVTAALLGLLGESDLVLADGDDLAAGLIERNIMLPGRNQPQRGGGR